MKGKNDGIQNESDIANAYNDEFQYLNEHQQEFVKELHSKVNEDTAIYTSSIGGRGYKPDISFEIMSEQINISVKKGGGNSVHQERTIFFTKYCRTELDMTYEEEKCLLAYLYGDGTLDGDSTPDERLTNDALKETYTKEIDSIQNFLNRNKRNLIERFLIYGRKGKEKDIRADYIYHGTVNEGVWCSFSDIAVDFIVDLKASGEPNLSIGPLTFQVWNRNPEADPKREDRRHSIQVKWPSCKKHISEINTHYKKRIHELKLVDALNIGDNSQGFKNQDDIVEHLNGRRYKQLNGNLKSLVLTMFPTIANTDTISAWKVKNNGIKPRLAIEVNEKVLYLSVFMGSGNAVHQEKTDGFLEFSNGLNITPAEEEALLQILFGDGTTDGSSSAIDRLSESEIKAKYPTELSIIRSFLDNNKREIVERALIYGKEGKRLNIKSDFIYYGTIKNGRCIPYPLIIEFLLDTEGSKIALLPVSGLTMQTWNRNLKAKPELENRRYSVQFKWGSMKSFLNQIYEKHLMNEKGKHSGDWEEFELVSHLNRHKNSNNEIWKELSSSLNIIDLDNVFAVKATKTKYSKLVKRNVLPKSDVFLIKAKLPHRFLLDNNYWIDEDNIENYDYELIEKSGISCKRPDSKSYTYCKLSINAFRSLFKNSIIGAGIMLFVNQKDLSLNDDIIKAWGCGIDEFYDYFTGCISIGNKDDLERAKAIKKYAINQVKDIIVDNRDIAESIFSGIGVFEEPFAASFLYVNGNMRSSHTPKFSITTGSGRHNGNYTIVIKP